MFMKPPGTLIYDISINEIIISGLQRGRYQFYCDMAPPHCIYNEHTFLSINVLLICPYSRYPCPVLRCRTTAGIYGHRPHRPPRFYVKYTCTFFFIN